MAGSRQFRWFETEAVGDATVVRFTHPGALVGGAVELVSEQLSRLVDERGCRHLVLDMGNVEALASAMVGRLIRLQKKLLAVDGRLKLCRVDPELQEMLHTVQFDQLVGIYADVEEALGTF